MKYLKAWIAIILILLASIPLFVCNLFVLIAVWADAGAQRIELFMDDVIFWSKH